MSILWYSFASRPYSQMASVTSHLGDSLRAFCLLFLSLPMAALSLVSGQGYAKPCSSNIWSRRLWGLDWVSLYPSISVLFSSSLECVQSTRQYLTWDLSEHGS